MTLDTLKYAKRLESAGLSTEIAEAQAEALKEALSNEIPTREDFGILRVDFGRLREDFGRLRQEFVRLEGKVQLLTWMVGFNLVLTTGVLFKLFA